jgi:hypothetical protein
MDQRLAIIGMLKHLLNDTVVLHQQGAGYYSCTPIVHRYNKLLEQASKLFPAGDGLISTFGPIRETDPNDPADKMKAMQAIRIEIGQLVSLLESLGRPEHAEGAAT